MLASAQHCVGECPALGWQASCITFARACTVLARARFTLARSRIALAYARFTLSRARTALANATNGDLLQFQKDPASIPVGSFCIMPVQSGTRFHPISRTR